CKNNFAILFFEISGSYLYSSKYLYWSSRTRRRSLRHSPVFQRMDLIAPTSKGDFPSSIWHTSMVGINLPSEKLADNQYSKIIIMSFVSQFPNFRTWEGEISQVGPQVLRGHVEDGTGDCSGSHVS